MTEEEIIRKIGELCDKYYADGQYSCAEAIVKAFAEVFVPHRFDPNLIPRIATPLNGGFSELNATCGVLTAGLLAVGLVTGRDQPGDEMAKEESYTVAQIFYKRYMEAAGSDNCRTLLDRWSHQGPNKSECKRHTREMSQLLARTILQVGFHELEVDEGEEAA